jgi:hypothetical protein
MITQPFGFAQGHEWFDVAHHLEHVEGPVEWQMMPLWWQGKKCLHPLRSLLTIAYKTQYLLI